MARRSPRWPRRSPGRPAGRPRADGPRRRVRPALVRRRRSDGGALDARADLPPGAVRPPPNPPPGRLTVAGPGDRALVIRWFADFADEALPPGEPVAPPDELVDRRIAQGGVFFWDDGGPVSLAVVGSRTPHGARVGPVYTPPERRGRGYASACVAGASQAQLDAGLALRVPVHRPGQSDLEPHLPGHRLRADPRHRQRGGSPSDADARHSAGRAERPGQRCGSVAHDGRRA